MKLVFYFLQTDNYKKNVLKIHSIVFVFAIEIQLAFFFPCRFTNKCINITLLRYAIYKCTIKENNISNFSFSRVKIGDCIPDVYCVFSVGQNKKQNKLTRHN